jgi:4-amino-4-deoxy-L-arabinose transferase-like glycosyltransferase
MRVVIVTQTEQVGERVAPADGARLPRRTHETVALLLAAGLVGGLLRLGLLERQGLWADEVFSLAMATGHSLEHPAAQADHSLGDYVEPPAPVPASHLRRYAEHGARAAGPARVVRAVWLSDTSPPLYYLALWAWTRGAGTGDSSLRLFSALWSLACLPLMWFIARRLGRERAGLVGVALFAVSPLAVFYGTEGRMYAMLLFFVLAGVPLTFRLQAEGPRPLLLVAWALVAGCGFLTHYFFPFAWIAMPVWLLLWPGRLRRRWTVTACVLTAALVLPWYAQLGESLSAWRVTEGWLKVPVEGHDPILSAARLAWGFVSGAGAWRAPPFGRLLPALVLLALAAVTVRRGAWRVLIQQQSLLIWLWILGAVVGPVVYDLASGTYAAEYARYGVAGLPAALLLLAAVLGRLGPRACAAFLVLMALAWTPGLVDLYRAPSRVNEPIREVAQLLDREVGPGEAVLAHTIPSGAIGVARYVGREDLLIMPWVHNLGVRQLPKDMWRLAAGRPRLWVAEIHSVFQPLMQQHWLNAHARLERVQQIASLTVWSYVPRTERAFAAAPPAGSSLPPDPSAEGRGRSDRDRATPASYRSWRVRINGVASAFVRWAVRPISWLYGAVFQAFVLGTVLLCSTRPAAPLFARAGRALSRLARRPRLGYGLVGAVAFVVAVTLAAARWPVPRVHDEFSQLLAADTFASGRLTNPSHPLWPHLEQLHVVHEPTLMSKYPPGTALSMAVGQALFGSTVVSLWLTAAAACVALTWMLRAALPMRLALAGGLLAATQRPLLEFTQTFTGGSLVTLGGALLLGGLGHSLRRQAWSAGLAIGLGLTILTCTRPSEGLVLAFLAGVPWLVLQVRRRSPLAPLARRVIAPAAALVALGGATMAYHNWRVTGSPTLMPYLLHAGTYSVAPNFVWQDPYPARSYRHKPFADLHGDWELAKYESHRTWRGFAREIYYKSTWLASHVLSPTAMWIALLAGLARWRSDPRARIATALGAAFLAIVIAAQVFINVHYVAPAAGLLLLLLVLGLDRLRRSSAGGIAVGPVLFRALVVLHLVGLALQFERHAREQGWHLERADLLERLEHTPGEHLVIVHYGERHDFMREWVANRADVDAAKVVWARDMGPHGNQPLLEHFRGRTVWLLDADREPEPSVMPYTEARAGSLWPEAQTSSAAALTRPAPQAIQP